jgi:hypothetical protein
MTLLSSRHRLLPRPSRKVAAWRLCWRPGSEWSGVSVIPQASKGTARSCGLHLRRSRARLRWPAAYPFPCPSLYPFPYIQTIDKLSITPHFPIPPPFPSIQTPPKAESSACGLWPPLTVEPPPLPPKGLSIQIRWGLRCR